MQSTVKELTEKIDDRSAIVTHRVQLKMTKQKLPKNFWRTKENFLLKVGHFSHLGTLTKTEFSENL